MSSAPAEVKHPGKYQFGDFQLSPNQAALWRDGARVPLMPKPMAALIVLVERAGQTVSKDELLAEVWNGAAVEDNNVTQTISALRKALGEKRGENRFIATDPGNGYRFVAVVTKIEPAPVQVLEPALVRPAIHPARSKWPLVFGAIIAFCLLVAAAVWTLKAGGSANRRRSVAVLGIRNLSKTPSEAWLQTALPEMLTSELASGGKLHTIPADDVVRWRSGLGSSVENTGNAGLVHAAHRNFGADVFVFGSYVVTGTCPECRVRVDLAILDAHTSETLASIIDEGPAQDLLDVTTRLGAKLRAGLGINTPADPSPWPAASAMREYAEGLKALRRIDPMAAREHLEIAAKTDPGNALIHSGLADAWTLLGYAARAGEESHRAYELASSLSRLDQLQIEARYRADAQQWDRAIEIYQSLYRLFPDSSEDGLNLAQAQFRGMKNADALSTLRALRQFPKPAGNDPRIDLLEARVLGTERDYPQTRDYARRAAQEAKSRGALYLFARARLLEGGAMQTMAEPGFYAVQTEARKVCEQLGDRQCVSQAWRIHGNERLTAGRLEEARDAYLQGLSVARALGDRGEQANILDGLGNVAESEMEWGQAEKDLQEAISLKNETGYNPSGVQVQLANLYLRMGRLPDAAQAADAAYSEAQKTNAREDMAEVLLLRAAFARRNGRLDSAQQLAEKAVADLRDSKSAETLTLALAALSSIATARGDLAKAQEFLAAAATSDFPINQGTVYPAARGAISEARAELLFANGKFEDAAGQARRAAADFSSAHQPEDSARASLIQANALEMLKRNPEARDASRQAEKAAVQIPDSLVLAKVRLTAWRLGSTEDAKEPADLHASIVSLQSPELSLEEGLNRAIVAKRSGAPNARRMFDSVATQAANAGLITLSRRCRSWIQ